MQKKTTKKAASAAKKTVKKTVKKAVKKTTTRKPEGETPSNIAVKKAVKKKAAPLPNDKAFATAAAQIARDLHCRDIVLLDLTGLSPATDYFLIATGTSDRQGRTVADEITMLAKKEYNIKCFGTAGYEQGQWILLDFVTVVVHIFADKYRDYYNLEMLWGDAKKIDY